MAVLQEGELINYTRLGGGAGVREWMVVLEEGESCGVQMLKEWI